MVHNNFIKYLLLSICSFLFFSSAALAEETLTFDKFLQTSIKNNPQYKISARDYLIALEQNKNAKSLEDWNLVLTGIHSESNPAQTSALSPTYQKTQTYSVGLSKYIAKTGTAISLEHNNTRLQANYTPITIPGVGSLTPTSPYYISSLSLTITQPLLKNSFGLATKNALKMSDYSLDIAKIKLSEDWEDFIATLYDDYLTWQKYYLNVKTYEQKNKTVENQLSLVKKQTRYGLSEDIDLVQIKQKLQGYKIMMEQAKMAYEAQTDKILRTMNNNETAKDKPKPNQFSQTSFKLEEEQASQYLITKSNLKQTTDVLVALQKINLETKENSELPDVNLIAEYKPNAYSQKFSDSISQIGEHNEYTITVSGSKSLGNSAAKSQAAQARNQYKKALENQQKTLLQARIGLKGFYTNLKYMDKMIKLNKTNLKLARQRLKLEKRKFNQGRSSVFFVLQAEDDVLAAENNLNELLFNREKVVNQIKAFTDRYLVSYHNLLGMEL